MVSIANHPGEVWVTHFYSVRYLVRRGKQHLHQIKGLFRLTRI